MACIHLRESSNCGGANEPHDVFFSSSSIFFSSSCKITIPLSSFHCVTITCHLMLQRCSYSTAWFIVIILKTSDAFISTVSEIPCNSIAILSTSQTINESTRPNGSGPRSTNLYKQPDAFVWIHFFEKLDRWIHRVEDVLCFGRYCCGVSFPCAPYFYPGQRYFLRRKRCRPFGSVKHNTDNPTASIS